jgi:hypothetical protein
VRGKEAVAEHPHHHVELLEYSFIGEQQRSDGAASSEARQWRRRSELSGLGFCVQVGAARARVRALNRGNGGSKAGGVAEPT